MNLVEGDIVLCTVDRIDKTTVFVKIEDNGQGTVITSEIAPGRIRNLRDYVSPGRKIVCKVLKIDSNNVHLSLRRVTPKEKKEVMDWHEKERNALSILKSVLHDKAPTVVEKVKQESTLVDFLQACKIDPKRLQSYMSGEEAEKVCKILSEKKEKQVEVKRKFSLSSKKPDGIKITQEVLSFCQGNCELSYISAGNFTIKIKAPDYKEANSKINSSLEIIEKKAKEKKLDFELKEE